MYSKILIPTDGSDLAGQGLDHGLRLAAEQKAEVVVVCVTEMWAPLAMADLGAAAVEAMEKFEEGMAAKAQQTLAEAKGRADKAGVSCRTLHLRDSRPAEGILKAAEDEKPDLIVMASHGRRGLDRLLLGSQTNEVVTLAKVPVLVVR